MNILLIGSGGREHALAAKIMDSDKCRTLYIAPGNPGTAALGENVSLDVTDHDAVITFVKEHDVACVVIGPEAPLVDGLADSLKSSSADLIVVGPSEEGAQLEGSKAYAKAFMARHEIPTAGYFECTSTNLEEGQRYLDEMSSPYVLKADGLAAGKGVLIIDDLNEAKTSLEEMLNGKFGAASEKVVIEEFLDGIEFSVFALTDGHSYTLLPMAKDYKRIGEGDKGLNTGGMGAVSPVPFVDDALKKKVIKRIVEPTIKGLAKDNIDYHGFVFFGLINVGGDPFVIEYNCRMGDPETEVVLPRLTSDLVEAFIAMHDGELANYKMLFNPRTAATVIVVSGGYPEAYEKGKLISNLPNAEDGYVFHAGTKIVEGSLVTNGGRVLAFTSFGEDVADSVNKSIRAAEGVQFDGKYFRRDIGQDLI